MAGNSGNTDTSLTNLKLTSVKLDGTNYPSWSMAVETYLLATKQLSYLTSSPPTDKTKEDDWRSGDAAIRTLLWNTMDSKISPQFMQCTSAKAIWDKCALMFSGRDNMTRVCDVWEELFDLRIGDMSASDYYSRFTTLCEKLDTYLPTTDDIRELAKRQQDMRVVLFLRGLGPTHSSLRQQIISQGTLPSVDEVFSRVLRCVPDSLSSAPVASAMVSQSSGGRGGRGRVPRGRGRSVFSLGRGRDGGRGAGSSRYCNHCQRAGHTESYCYTLHPELRPRAAYAEAVESPVQKVPDKSQELPSTIMLTRAEYESLVRHNQVVDSSAPTATLAQTSSGSPSCLLSSAPTSWVVDSGATNHMTGSEDRTDDWWRT
ncbi:uncharacterized protein LOC130138508 [Syzygium oleosum]|uniref:uncharacterized protein LOC130138508 n=1 Tax=Syzygium oleosum TaxID=219896 RepID=UPI0024BB8B96|nr:uncharacterized protein LOC130138508 [Syzygium oleosum]